MRTLPAEDPSAHDAFCVLHRNLSAPRLEKHDRSDDPYHGDEQSDQREAAQLTDLEEPIGFDDRVGQPRDDSGKNDQRDAIADTPLGDLFTKPHQKGSPGCQREHRHQPKAPPRGLDKGAAVHPFEANGDTEGLNQTNPNGAESGVLNDLLPTPFSFLGEFREMRDDDRQ